LASQPPGRRVHIHRTTPYADCVSYQTKPKSNPFPSIPSATQKMPGSRQPIFNPASDAIHFKWNRFEYQEATERPAS
jgi:hypothetical protein